MQQFMNLFVQDIMPMNLTIIGLGLVLIFLILLFIIPILSNMLFPAFSYSSFAKYLPFKQPFKDKVSIELNDGGLVRVYKLKGVQTSLQDQQQKEQFLDLRAQLFQQIKDPNITFRFFMLREKMSVKTDYTFDEPVLQKIYDKWNSQGIKVFDNQYYLVVSISGNKPEDRIGSVSTMVESILAPYQPKLCFNSDENNAGSFYSRILSPITRPILKGLNSSMNDLMTSDQVEFLEGGKIRFSAGDIEKYAGLVSIKTAPDFFDEDFFNDLGTVSCEMVTMNAFQLLSIAKTEALIKQKQSVATSNKESEDIAVEQIEETMTMMDENISGTQSLMNYYPLFVLYGETADEVDKSIQELQKICAAYGISPVVENFASKVSWFSMLPGFDVFPRTYKLLSRTAAITWPLSTVPVGIPNSDWGPGPIVVFPTSLGTPYQFQFHVSEQSGAVGHTLTIGPTGQGKTTLFSFLISQSLRHPKLKSFFFDRNRGAEIFTLATGGKYLTFENKSQNADKINAGFQTRLNPLLMEDSASNRDFLRRWFSMISGQDDPKSLDEIARAVAVNFDYLDPKDRMLKNLYNSCFSSEGKMRPALKKWVDDLQYGSVFNEPQDTLDLYSRLSTFDFTDILSDETLAPAVISYLIQRINSLTVAQGNPSLIMIDETAPMLANPMFRQNFITGLQEGRKNRQAYMAAFQQANIIDKLGIGDVVRGQAQTILFFRNPGADPLDYQHWRLNPREMAFIQGKAYPNLKRAVLLSRPVTGESVVLNTELGGLGSYLKLFESGRSSVLLAEELYSKMGGEFVDTYLRRVSTENV